MCGCARLSESFLGEQAILYEMLCPGSYGKYLLTFPHMVCASGPTLINSPKGSVEEPSAKRASIRNPRNKDPFVEWSVPRVDDYIAVSWPLSREFICTNKPGSMGHNAYLRELL